MAFKNIKTWIKKPEIRTKSPAGILEIEGTMNLGFPDLIPYLPYDKDETNNDSLQNTKDHHPNFSLDMNQ